MKLPTLKDKSILITGGAGTLGRELVKQILPYNPRRIIVFSRDDTKHHLMENDIGAHPRIRYWIGNVRDLERLRMAFSDVDYVIHCAALKHVERGEVNPLEYKRTIVDGAENVIKAAIECGVKRVVALSTDKACSPLNTYGACKLMSDRLFINANEFSKTNFAVIRYGNVVASNGSVVAKLNNQVDETELKITSPEMTRFWITKEYAARLVLLLLEHMLGKELLIPKLPSCLVWRFLNVLKPNACISWIPIRAGEKIHESMITEEDSRHTLEYGFYYIVYPELPDKRKRTFAGEIGKHSEKMFSYNSSLNSCMSAEDVIKMVSGTFEFPTLDPEIDGDPLKSSYTTFLNQTDVRPLINN